MMGNEIEHLFRFPKVLPNDVEDFTVYYPKKFPPIKEYYTKLVKQLHNNPVKFRQTCFDLQKDLFQGFEKIKKDYDNCKKKDLDFLIDIDQRLHKLFCYRFWIINYLFCDGPLHDYYVSKVREYAEKVSVWEDLDEKDKSVLQLERDLLQSDYADLYLKSVLKGIKLYDLMISNKTLKKYSDDIKAKVAVEKYDDSYAIIEKLLIELESHKDNKLYQEVMKLLPFHGAKVRGDNLMVYNVVIHSIQFRQKSLDLQQRFESMKVRLEKIVKLAKKKLSKKEYFCKIPYLSHRLLFFINL